MSLLFPSTNQPSGDVIVTTSKEAVGVQYARSIPGGLLPAALSIPLFQSEVRPGEQIVFDVQTFFSGTITSFVYPPDFLFKKILLNGQPFVTPLKSLNVDALSTANIAALTGLTTIVDNVKLNANGMLVLLSGQTTGAQNGVWTIDAGAWFRPADYFTSQHYSQTFVGVIRGTVHAGQVWRTLTTNPDVIDTNTPTFALYTQAFTTGSYAFFFDSTEDSEAAFFRGALGVTIP